MQLNATTYDLLMDAAGAIYRAMGQAQARASPPAEPPPALLQVRAGLAESVGWFLVQAGEFDPEPLTVERLRVRDVYASERIVEALLELMASERWFTRDAAGAYALSPAGRSVLLQRRAARRALTDPLALLATADLEQLAGLLRRLIDASLASAAPPGTWCLAHSRRRAPEDAAPPTTRILQYFDDLNAFRDDAHMAAWQPLDLAGYVWEAFALVVGGQAGTAAQLYDQLAYRGYSQIEYAGALDLLAQRGWVSAGLSGTYLATLAGREVHTTAEQLTDTYFYQPWEVLQPDELAWLHELLVRLRDASAA